MAKQRSSNTEAKEVIAKIRKRQLLPVYLLHGEEPYFSNRITEQLISTVLTEEEKGFNQFILYGRDVTPGEVHDMALRSPMGASQILLVVREAQELRQVEPLVEYLKKPSPTTILVLCYSAKMKVGQGKNSAAKQLAARVAEIGYIHEFTPLRDSEIPRWIDAQIAERGFTAEPAVSQAMAEQIGTDLSSIANELAKLALLLPPDVKHITLQIVRDAVGLSRAYYGYELTQAMGKGQLQRALSIALTLGQQKEGGEIPVVIATMFGYFNRLFQVGVLRNEMPARDLAPHVGVNPYLIGDYIDASDRFPPARCARIISYLRMWDLRGKGLGAVDTPRAEVFKEIVTYIMLT